MALVGESGGGKSTLAKLIARFYDPSSGAVRVDGIDLREVDCAATGGSSASCSRIRSSSPARSPTTSASPALRRRTTRWPRPQPRSESTGSPPASHGGLEHRVREGGAGLSAGERQLISIARALLADPRVLILDEATSNIDRPTEILIERALDRLLRGRTSIVIAHRLATVRRADEILVIEHGAVVQRGSEDELLAAPGPFRRLARELSAPSVAVPGSGEDARDDDADPDRRRNRKHDQRVGGGR